MTSDADVPLVDVWNRTYFDGRLSHTVVDILRSLENADDSARAFAERAFRLIRHAGIEGTDVSHLTAWQVGVVAPRVLPSAQGGVIPSITTPGRHKLFDEYVLANPWHRPTRRGVMLDLGCGFPPLTTVESAIRLAHWDVIGADPVFVRHPPRDYERPNLRFTEGGIGEVAVDGDAEVIRCMNVLLYFDRGFRTRALEWAASVLVPGGLFICGADWARSTSARYSVYQRDGDAMVRREFAFGIECVRPIDFLSWYTLQSDEPEALLLADAVRTLRADDAFRRAYDARLDEILTTTAMCPRDADGYLGRPPLDLMPEELEERLESIGLTLAADGFADRAVEVLERSGRRAWVNCVGHVASLPDDIASLDALESYP